MDSVQLDNYNILIGNIEQTFKSFIKDKQYSRIIIIVDENTSRDCLPILLKKINIETPIIIQIQAGEVHKTIETCQKIWQKMMEKGVDRRGLVLNLGGGVIGDMGGFCASTFKRGIDFVQIPTTLLSQVDASIGGKLGIDFGEIKNSVGIFRNPQAVLIDVQFLKTLSSREVRSGFAELIKHALIDDLKHWEELSKIDDLNVVDWNVYLKNSLLVKKCVVEEDPFEKGWRKVLNFGHTIGHAIESIALKTNTPFLHGEAIAIGMVCESWLSYKEAKLPKKELDFITQFILKLYAHHPLKEEQFDDYIKLMQNDKKNENSLINFTLLEEIGTPKVNQNCSDDLIKNSLKYYNTISF